MVDRHDPLQHQRSNALVLVVPQTANGQLLQQYLACMLFNHTPQNILHKTCSYGRLLSHSLNSSCDITSLHPHYDAVQCLCNAVESGVILLKVVGFLFWQCALMLSVYVVQWLRSISKTQMLEKDDPVYEWRDRMFKQFEGTISKAHTYPV